MNRIHALDALRGLLLVLMTINHLVWISGGNTFLQYFTLQPLGQVGAAEGFIFISGLLAGLIYSADKYSNKQVVSKAVHRAWTIYCYHIICLLLVLAVAWIAISIYPSARDVYQTSMPNFFQAPEHASWLSLLLLNRPAYFDILPLYIIFMLVLPAVIIAFRRGYGWLALAVSVALWLSSSWFTQTSLTGLYQSVSPALGISVGYFDPWAWQLLFMMGAAIGYGKRQQSINWYASNVPVWIALIVVAAIFITHHGVFLSMGIHQGVLYQFADKPELGWLRILNLLLWVYLLGFVISRWPNALNIPGLRLLGRHSLQVFAWQTLLIFIVAPYLQQLGDSGSYTLWLILLTCTLFIAAFIHQQWQNKQREKVQQTTPNLA
ncbi:OpgC family protein [Motilimonas cestriensis]|uniref:OpgC family protein n=1 Tax=Motilimonas cestriensis TaxID=2742685 RepID=UPI003DA27B13